MSLTTDSAIQVKRLAHLLHAEPDALGMLRGLPADELRTLHDQVVEALFAANREKFARVASLARFLPGAVAGKLAEHYLPAGLAARCAELLEPERARGLVGHVSVPYLADLALHLDPTRSRPVVQAIPAERVGPVAAELFRRREFGAMAEFAGTVTYEALVAALDVATGEELLRVVPLLTWNENIERVVDEVPAEQIDAILTDLVATGLYDEADYLINRLSPEARERVVGRAADVSADVFGAIQEVARTGRFSPVTMDLLGKAEALR